MNSLDLEVTPVFVENYETDARLVVNRGGTRSSKTYSLAQLHIQKLISEPNKRFLISRKTFPALRTSAMSDVIDLLKEYGLYESAWHNKTEHTFEYPPTESKLYFISIDDEQKIRGPEWNYAWFNEANEMTYDDFKQVNMRLSRESEDGKPNQFFFDFNPDDEDIWLNRKIEQSTQYDFNLIHSTYEDNTFLDAETIRTIKQFQEHDPEFWKIYGLGLYGRRAGQIFHNWQLVPTFPDPNECQWIEYGLDFGFSNHPSALLKVAFAHGELYWQGQFYETGLTNQMISEKLHQNRIKKDDIIVADSAEPKSIAELRKDGWKVLPAEKGRDSINYSINLLQQYTINIVDGDPDLKKEMRNYKWEQDKNGDYLNKPIDAHNHYIDGGRYVAMRKLKNQAFHFAPRQARKKRR